MRGGERMSWCETTRRRRRRRRRRNGTRLFPPRPRSVTPASSESPPPRLHPNLIQFPTQASLDRHHYPSTVPTITFVQSSRISLASGSFRALSGSIQYEYFAVLFHVTSPLSPIVADFDAEQSLQNDPTWFPLCYFVERSVTGRSRLRPVGRHAADRSRDGFSTALRHAHWASSRLEGGRAVVGSDTVRSIARGSLD